MIDRRGAGPALIVAACLFAAALFAAPASAQELMFVANYGTNTVTVYPRDVNGAVSASRTISLGLNGPHQLAINQQTRELFVTNNLDYTVSVFDADSGALKRSLGGTATGLYRPVAIGINPTAGELYVSNDAPYNSITVYDIGASGDVAWKREIHGDATGLQQPGGMVIDTVNNEVSVSNYNFTGAPSITVYDLFANGNVTPKRVIAGAATLLDRPQGLTIDTVRDELIVGNSAFDHNPGSIITFDRTANGNVAPIRQLAGSNTQLCNPISVQFDATRGELLTANSDFSTLCTESVATYSWPPVTANQAPLRINVDPTDGPVGNTHPTSAGIYSPSTDTTGPTITVPAMLTLEANSPAGAIGTFTATASDPSGVNGAVTCTYPSGTRFPIGNTTVSCSATDTVGNTATASFNVLVQDTLPPTVTAPPNQTATQTSADGAVVTYPAPAVFESGSGVVSQSCTPASGTQFPVGKTTVTCTATDNAGNVGSATFVVTVNAASQLIDGSMYGIGYVAAGRTHNHFLFRMTHLGNRDYGLFEFWTYDGGCSASDDDYSDSSKNGNRETDYGRSHRQLNFFFATSIVAKFTDNPSVNPGDGVKADTLTFSGAGWWNLRPGYTFTGVATDKGEPGKGVDTFTITIKDSRGNIVATVNGALNGGNLQSTRIR
jgi:hypothetical protein